MPTRADIGEHKTRTRTCRRALLAALMTAGLAGGGASLAQQSINRGLTGNWYNPETSGQGLMLEVFPENEKIFVVWFTYEPAGGRQLWLTGTGDYQGAEAQFDLLRRAGGRFDRPGEPEAQTWGAGALRFESCDKAVFRYTQEGESPVDIPMQRIAPDHSCGQAPAAGGGEPRREHIVTVTNHRFDPEVLSVQTGDTVTWINAGGEHNVVATDGEFVSGDPASGWRYSHTFSTADDEILYRSETRDGMFGAVVVEPAFDLSFGASGSWFDPEESGQGFLIEYVPSTDRVVAGWFTYSPDTGEPQWMTAVGVADRNRVSIPLRRPVGGALNRSNSPEQPDWGTLDLVFHDCEHMTATYESRADLVSGTTRLQRIAPAPDCVDP